MTVRVPDVSRAAARSADIAGQPGGYVSQENVTPRPGHSGGGSASIQLRIPVAAYPAALTELARLGVQTALRQQAQDVTQQVADTASRVSSDQAAIAQLRALLSRAGSVGALLTVQDQINAQESGLEALQAQQRALNHETVYATVSLRLVGPPIVRHGSKQTPTQPGGFIGGLTAAGRDWWRWSPGWRRRSAPSCRSGPPARWPSTWVTGPGAGSSAAPPAPAARSQWSSRSCCAILAWTRSRSASSPQTGNHRNQVTAGHRRCLAIDVVR